MKKLLFLSVFLIILSGALRAQENQPMHSFIDESVANHWKPKQASGLVVGLVIGDQTYYFGYGETTKGSGQAPDARSLFEIGEVTEVFTTSILAEFVMRGEVSLNDPLSKFLPANLRVPGYSGPVCEPTRVPLISDLLNDPIYVCAPENESQQEPIILCDLATHTTGFPSLRHYKLQTRFLHKHFLPHRMERTSLLSLTRKYYS